MITASFDANMRHLPEGFEFIAQLQGWGRDGNELDKYIKQHDFVRATVKYEHVYNMIVVLHLHEGDFEVQCVSRGYNGRFTYEGHADLKTDFSYDHIRAAAVEYFEKYDEQNTR